MVRATLYARVSTQDQHTLPMQNRAMREYAARRGWTIAMQVKEVGSGATQRQLRAKLLEAARRREIDVVLVWRLDRWGRSVADLLATLQELEHLGVGFVSSNLSPEARASFLDNELNLMNSLNPQFDAIAEEQSKRLVAAHERFSSLMDKQRFQVVYPVLPMDLLGIYILLPEEAL